MQRQKRAWARVVVCANRSSIRLLGQGKDDNTEGSTLVINRTRIEDISETASLDSDSEMSSIVRGVAILGFLEVRNAVYLGVVSKASVAGRIGNHNIFCVSEVEWVPISFGITAPNKVDSRSLGLISNLFRSNDFYFSDTLDLTRKNGRYQWNHMHSSRLRGFSEEWTVDIMHGFFDSVSFCSLNRCFQFALIARRSQFFAGTRYRKRGLNGEGDCANEVEFEQIFISFGPPDHVFAFKQVRGSVPLKWSQDSQGILGRPEISINHSDLNLELTRMHFDTLACRYGSPVVPVSLLMSKEGSSENELNVAYGEAVEWLQSRLRGEVHSVIKFDLKGATAESPSTGACGSSMYEDSHRLCERILEKTGWSHQINNHLTVKQSGIVRSNCLDCLDRTSIFQYVLGLQVLSKQLISLGLLDPSKPMKPSWTSESAESNNLVVLIEGIFEAASDQLALQYAGTAAHRKYSSGQVSRQGSIDGGLISSGRELFISLSRHYSSTFSDMDKQNAMNLFLGLYKGCVESLSGEDNCFAIEGLDRFAHSRFRRGIETHVEDHGIILDFGDDEVVDLFKGKDWVEISFNPVFPYE